MAAGSFESRLSNIEELCIIIIIIVWGGGGRGPGHPGPSDSIANDATRMETLMRLVRPGIIPDPGPPDLARLSLEAVETRLLAVNAELTRLRAQEGELNARVKELRGAKSK
jgi:hypothetical protein